MDRKKEFTLYESDKIFATGVFLRPAECIINGVKQWRWVSDGFTNESYFDGDGEPINVYDYANDLQGLLNNSEDSE